MRFYLADTLTGRIVGRVTPTQWDYVDPLTGSGQGRVVLAGGDAARAAGLVRRIRTQVVFEDDAGHCQGGPVVTSPSRGDDGTVTVEYACWRSWWRRALLWPNADGSRRDVFAAGVEQATLLKQVAGHGLDHPAAPPMVCDELAATGVARTGTWRMLTPVGDMFDELSRMERGPDWWTYLIRDGVTFIPHLAFGYPYRALRATPVVLRHEVGRGGNVHGVTWPPGQERVNVVYGVAGAPPDQGWAVAEHDAVADATELVWPEVWPLPADTRTSRAAFEHCYERLSALSGEEGTGTAVVDPGSPRVEEYGPGDLARLVVDDGWRQVDLPTTRILARALTGAGEDVTGVTLTLDLGYDPPDTDTDPGEVV